MHALGIKSVPLGMFSSTVSSARLKFSTNSFSSRFGEGGKRDSILTHGYYKKAAQAVDDIAKVSEDDPYSSWFLPTDKALPPVPAEPVVKATEPVVTAVGQPDTPGQALAKLVRPRVRFRPTCIRLSETSPFFLLLSAPAAPHLRLPHLNPHPYRSIISQISTMRVPWRLWSAWPSPSSPRPSTPATRSRTSSLPSTSHRTSYTAQQASPY